MQGNNMDKYDPHGSAYGPSFWLAYLANLLLVVAVSILFRYADFVHCLGGTELDLGLIVGIGMIGSLVVRWAQGIAIDRFGPRRIWLLSLLLLVVTLIAHLGISSLDGPAIYLLRVVLAIAIAGAFGSAITHVSLNAPPHRLAEMIGMLGTSGFVGMSVGPLISDLLLDVSHRTRQHVDQMFLTAAAMGLASLVFAAAATRGARRAPLRSRVPVRYILRRYHPGSILIVGMAMGLGLGLPHTFLRTYTGELGIDRMSIFFLVYALVATIVRVATRRLTDQYGSGPMVHLGLVSLAATMLLFLVVRSQWMLVIPATAGGVAHALLFPAVVSEASVSFPRRYRGIATSLIMAMFDLGNLVGQPTVGAIIDGSHRIGLPPYGTMFVCVALTLLGVSAVYASSTRRHSVASQPHAAIPQPNAEGCESYELSSSL